MERFRLPLEDHAVEVETGGGPVVQKNLIAQGGPAVEAEKGDNPQGHEDPAALVGIKGGDDLLVDRVQDQHLEIEEGLLGVLLDGQGLLLEKEREAEAEAESIWI